MNKIKTCSLFTFTLLVLSSFFAHALSVKSLTLDQVLSFSSTVFRGTLVDMSLDDDTEESGSLVKYFTFKVDDCLKGDCGERIIFKQLARGPAGMPDYNMGKSYLLFLPEASERTGLLAPVGIDQGRYELEKENGQWVVPALRKRSVSVKTLGLRTKGLTTPTSVISYEDFKSEILNHLDN